MALSEEEKAKRRAYYAANKDRIREQRRAAYLVNRDKLIERQKKYAARNKALIALRNKRNYDADVDARRRKARAYYESHIEERRQYDRARYESRRLSQSSYRKTWREKNPDKVAQYVETAKQSERYFKYEIKRKCKAVGIEVHEYLAMVHAQNNKCAICLTEETESGGNGRAVRSLAIDHDHDTGKVRGLLCGMCNKGIGAFHDNPDLMRRAVLYLEGHGR